MADPSQTSVWTYPTIGADTPFFPPPTTPKLHLETPKKHVPQIRRRRPFGLTPRSAQTHHFSHHPRRRNCTWRFQKPCTPDPAHTSVLTYPTIGANTPLFPPPSTYEKKTYLLAPGFDLSGGGSKPGGLDDGLLDGLRPEQVALLVDLQVLLGPVGRHRATRLFYLGNGFFNLRGEGRGDLIFSIRKAGVRGGVVGMIVPE